AVGSCRPAVAPGQSLCRGRTAPPRVSDHPREDTARPLDDVQHEGNARRGAPGPEEVRRRRTAAAGRLRGDEKAAGEDPAARPAPPGRGRRAARATVRGKGKEGRSDQVDEGTGGAEGPGEAELAAVLEAIPGIRDGFAGQNTPGRVTAQPGGQHVRAVSR